MRFLSTLFFCVISVQSLAQTGESAKNSDVVDSVKNKVELKKEDAKTETQAQDSSRIEKLEVTGSHIKRIDVEGPSPVLTIDQDDLVRSGYNSVSDVLRDAGVSSFGSFRETSGQQGAGTASVDLRGLGQVRTLVLLDGQRLPSDAINGSVDMNIIPMAAVERIEVLKDGASAIYGSDALGGVVNIITKKEFTGHEVGGSFSLTELKGGERRDLSYTSGYSTSRFNLVNVLFFRHNERIEARHRDWSKNNFTSTGSPGSYSTDNGATFNPDPNCDPSLIINNRCYYNFGNDKWEMPYVMQGSLMSRATYDLSESLTAVARLSYTFKETEWVHAPTSSSAFSMNPAPPQIGGPPITNILYRFKELGNRSSNTKTNVGSTLLGLKGYMLDTWDWQTNVSFNKIDRKERRRGYALTADIQNAIDTSQFNPFAPYGARGDLSGLLYEPQQNNISENSFFEAKATGEVGELGDHPVSLAVGVQAGRELYRDSADDRSLNGEVFGFTFGSGGGSRNSVSVFSEVGTIFFNSLETLAALRYDHYEGFGDTINPKLSLRYSPIKELMLRTSVGTGFKAPQMQNLYAAQTSATSSFVDAVYCQKDPGSGCSSQSHPVVEGGNPNLKEETSFSFNIGTIVQPVKAHSFGFDFWYYDLKDLVSAPDYKALTEQEANGVNIADYGAIATRNPTTGQLIGSGLLASFLNIASTETQGVDFNYNGKMATSWGDFRLRFEHSHMIYYKTETLPGVGVTDRVGQYGRPRWRNNTTLFYIPNPNHEYSLLARTVGQNAKRSASAGRQHTYTEYDLRYSLVLNSWDGKLTLGIKNILGTLPPFEDLNLLDPDLNYSLYDGRGRSVFVGYRQSF